MPARPLAHGRWRAHREARARRLLEKFAFALAGAALLATLLFVMVQVNEAVNALRADPASADIYYSNCAAARADGAAPIYAGQPGYRPGLDAGHDGVACEPYRNRGANR